MVLVVWSEEFPPGWRGGKDEKDGSVWVFILCRVKSPDNGDGVEVSGVDVEGFVPDKTSTC